MKLETEKTQLIEKYSAEIKSWKEKLANLEHKYKEDIKLLQKELIEKYEKEKEEFEENFLKEKEELMESHKAPFPHTRIFIRSITSLEFLKIAVASGRNSWSTVAIRGAP